MCLVLYIRRKLSKNLPKIAAYQKKSFWRNVHKKCFWHRFGLANSINTYSRLELRSSCCEWELYLIRAILTQNLRHQLQFYKGVFNTVWEMDGERYSILFSIVSVLLK